jgi:hypothetical protein
MTVASRGGGDLSREQVTQFERDGYFVIDGGCPPELIDGVLADIDPMLRDAWDPALQAERDGVRYYKSGGWSGAGGGYAWQRILNAWKTSDAVRELALLDPLLNAAEELFGRSVKPFQTLNFPVGTEQAPHADSFHFQSDPPGYMCGIWVALEDMDMENGPLVYFPGSHRLPMPTWDIIEEATGRVVERKDFDDHQKYIEARNSQYEEYCRWLREAHGLKPSFGTIRKGQALLWAPNLLHGGSPQRDRARTRHSQVTHYFFEGCRVYTPMHVEGGHVYWEYPEWIRDPVPSYSPASVHAAIRQHVPEGSTVLVAANQSDELMNLDRYDVVLFTANDNGVPWTEVGDSDALEALETLRGRGAEYIIFPKPELPRLEWGFPELQEHLENRCQGLLRDGAIGALYALR